MRKQSLAKWDDSDNIDGYIRLIEGILLNVLDRISISEKWYHRKITPRMILRKKAMIKEIREWFKNENYDILVKIYSKESGVDRTLIKKSFRRVMARSTKFLNKETKKMPEIIKEYKKTHVIIV